MTLSFKEKRDLLVKHFPESQWCLDEEGILHWDLDNPQQKPSWTDLVNLASLEEVRKRKSFELLNNFNISKQLSISKDGLSLNIPYSNPDINIIKDILKNTYFTSNAKVIKFWTITSEGYKYLIEMNAILWGFFLRSYAEIRVLNREKFTEVSHRIKSYSTIGQLENINTNCFNSANEIKLESSLISHLLPIEDRVLTFTKTEII